MCWAPRDCACLLTGGEEPQKLGKGRFGTNWLHASLTASSCLLRTRYLTSLRGHVSAVYQIAWSADSRLLVSGSSDSTLKVWDAKMKKLAIDLPGHADEVRRLVEPRCLREAGMTPPSRDNCLSLILGVCNGLEPGRTEGSKWREG